MKRTLMCPKCGFIRTPLKDSHSYDICEYCHTDTHQIDFNPDDFWTTDGEERNAVENKIWRKFLYNNPQFNEETFEQRLKDAKVRSEEVKKRLASIPPSNTPKCPYCNSLYVEKITTGGRLISTALFGLGSSKVGKQWHCKQCGSNF